MNPMHINKTCGARLVPMTSKEMHEHRQHPRATRDHRGRLASDFGPGRRTRRRHAHMVAASMQKEGALRLVGFLGAHITPGGMAALDHAMAQGLPPLACLLHACKGACVDMQDYERAQQFRDMAAREESV